MHEIYSKSINVTALDIKPMFVVTCFIWKCASAIIFFIIIANIFFYKAIIFIHFKCSQTPIHLWAIQTNGTTIIFSTFAQGANKAVSGFHHVLHLVRSNLRKITGWIQLGSSRSIRATTQPGSNTVPGLFKKWMQPECWTCRVITIFITCKKDKSVKSKNVPCIHLCQSHIMSFRVHDKVHSVETAA